MKHLFIGGEFDGQRLSVDSDAFYWRTIKRPKQIFHYAGPQGECPDPGDLDFETVDYRRVRFNREFPDLDIFVLDSLPHIDWITKLIKHYKPNQ